jgi:hypothetical protein
MSRNSQNSSPNCNVSGLVEKPWIGHGTKFKISGFWWFLKINFQWKNAHTKLFIIHYQINVAPFLKVNQ